MVLTDSVSLFLAGEGVALVDVFRVVGILVGGVVELSVARCERGKMKLNKKIVWTEVRERLATRK